jgi:hypothetical protein
MNVKLYLRLAVLTAMLFMLVSAFKTQSVWACSPGWYEGCTSSCDSAFFDCTNGGGTNCNPKHSSCLGNCNAKLAACYPQGN